MKEWRRLAAIGSLILLLGACGGGSSGTDGNGGGGNGGSSVDLAPIASERLVFNLPTQELQISAGQSLVVQFAPVGDQSVQSFDRGIVPFSDGPLHLTLDTSTSPFSIRVRANVGAKPGVYRVTALGLSAGKATEYAMPAFVRVLPSQVGTINVSSSALVFSEGNQVAGLHVTAADVSGKTVDLPMDEFDFRSENPLVAVVGRNGVVRAVGAGKTKLIVRYGSISRTIDVTVRPGD